MLFTDGSVNIQTKIGYGAYLAISENSFSLDLLKSLVKVQRFENTSSTKLELQTLLWALNDIQLVEKKVSIYTDSQNIIGLMRRRKRFEQNKYLTKSKKLITNYLLYKEFYKITDHINCEFVKVCGHKKTIQKNYIDNIFTIVDRASRNAMRKDKI